MRNIPKKYLIVLLILIMSLGLVSCGSDMGTEGDASSADLSGYSGQDIILEISGYNDGTSSYSVDDMKEIGLETRIYSGRNKENNNERQIREYTGIDLKALLENAGYGSEDETMKIICSDGYTREYALDDISGLWYFADEKAEDGTEVEPMLAIMQDGEKLGNDSEYKESDGSPLRLIYGQADYDSEYTKDFNMQGWATYIEKIEISKAP